MGCRAWTIAIAEFVSHEARSEGVYATASPKPERRSPRQQPAQSGRVTSAVQTWADVRGRRPSERHLSSEICAQGVHGWSVRGRQRVQPGPSGAMRVAPGR